MDFDVVEFGRAVERRPSRKLAVEAEFPMLYEIRTDFNVGYRDTTPHLPVTILVEFSARGGDCADDGGQHAGHSVEIVHAASVVYFQRPLDSWLRAANKSSATAAATKRER